MPNKMPLAGGSALRTHESVTNLHLIESFSIKHEIYSHSTMTDNMDTYVLLATTWVSIYPVADV